MIFVVAAWGGVVLNEVLPNPGGSDAGQEWVELYNTGPDPVDLAGWELQSATSSWTTRHLFVDTVLQPGDLLWVGEPGGVDVTTGSLGLGNAGSSGDGVRLLDPGGTVVDLLVYGPDDGGLGAPPDLPAPGTDEGLARRPDGGLWTLDAPSPGASNVPVCADAPSVQISELLPDPEGPDSGREWVELVGLEDADLRGWQLDSGGSAYTRTLTLPDDAFVPAGGRLVLASSAAVQADLLLPDLSLGNGSGADAVRLRDCHGEVADELVYGGPNTDGWTLPGGELGPTPPSGISLGRVEPDGPLELLEPTPGDPNRPLPPPCTAAPWGVLINEVGPGWVELLAAGDLPQPVPDWTLEHHDASGWQTLQVLAGTVEPGERWTVAAHLPTPTSLRLVDCSGAVVDLVDVERPEDLSLQRLPDGFDTDRSSDWRPAPPTRDAPNQPAPCPGGLQLAELLPDPEGADAGQEWVELLASEEGRSEGWSLRVQDREHPVEAGSFLRGERLLVEVPLPNGASATTVSLVDCGGSVVDTLVYGPPDQGGAVSPTEGLSLVRMDTHWEVGLPTPGRGPIPWAAAPEHGCRIGPPSVPSGVWALVLAGLLRRRRVTPRTGVVHACADPVWHGSVRQPAPRGGPLAILEIITAPHPILEMAARDVEADELGPELERHLRDMAETMYAAPGVGLAGPQVSDPRRVVVIDSSSKEERGSRLFLMVNPKIVEGSDDLIPWYETCLSVPDMEVKVMRHRRVRVEWIEPLDGKARSEWFEEYEAVIVQHELDHLAGTVLLDRASRMKRARYLRANKKKVKVTA